MRGFILPISCFICHICMCSSFEDKSIYQWLTSNGHPTAAYAIDFIGLKAEMESSGPYTMFLPSDSAIRKQLSASEFQALFTDQKEANYFIKYHVIPKFLLTSSVTGPTNVTTLDGESILIEPSPSGLLINHRSHVLPGSDVILNNGIIHRIDRILEPPSQPNIITITDILLKHASIFRDVYTALLQTNLTHILDNGDCTLFAPINSAFAQFQDTLLNRTSPGGSQTYDDIIRYHIVPGRRMAADLKDGQILYTLQGTALNVTINNSGVFINNAKVIDPDLSGENGVVHGIDHLLIPDSLKAYAYGNQG